TAVPKNLRKSFTEEPFYIDLRWARHEEHLSLRHPQFHDAVASLAAALHNQPKDVIAGEEVRQQRKTMRMVWGAVMSLTLLTILSSLGAYIAIQQRNEARRLRFVSLAQSL